ncbi:MAG: TAXI family TRAP transporter solute-binding subunit [Beijerinckiaceae bacterium]
MKRRVAFTSIAVILGLIGVVIGAVFVSRMPRMLTLAVGPEGQETHRYAQALVKAASDVRDRVRYQIVTTSGAAESARLLEDRKVNLAIVRSDFELPANGQTIIVNARRVALVMAPQLRRGGIQKFSDLKGKRVAVARMTDPNLPLVRRMLAAADLADGDVTLVESELAELPELLASGKVDAAIAIVIAASPAVAELIPQIARRLPNGLKFVPLNEAEAIANRNIGVETAEIPAGTFGSGRPQEETATVAITYRTMARSTMPEATAEQVAKSMYDLRTRVARQLPAAFGAEAPDAKTGARIAVHPGAMAFFDGESKTFMERYGEILLTVLWGGSILGSALTGVLAWLSGRRREHGGPILARIAELTAEAREATAATLQPIEAQVDAIVVELARHNANGDIADGVVDSAALALDHFRSVAEVARGRAA